MRLLRHSKRLDPIPQFRAMAKLSEFLEARLSQSFSPWDGPGPSAQAVTRVS